MPPVSGFQQPQALQEVSQPDTLRLVAAMLGHPLWRQSLAATQVAILVADIVAVATRHEEAGVSPASVNACAEGDEIGPFRVDLPATRCIGPVWNVGRESRRTGGCKAERADKECSRRETRVHMTHARSFHCCDCTRAGGGKSLMVAHRFAAPNGCMRRRLASVGKTTPGQSARGKGMSEDGTRARPQSGTHTR